ncbi:tonB-system energizer ExbB [Paracoccus siganidrum]|uniref:Biopolymer transport protein ExbB n=1 Tax=Paracoccus siganidrum TaxID=1276757 RepID=A0A419A5P3_9RHOB|nr:tonB-system energizer ExbB [Paracoccus siganidrum]RJL12557.1 tonB-system energizer ExbB [Paracoccus siganidrum]RMC37093.1 tonB-system energizer ExbB [Paracoccus siganidrum]
MLTCPADRKPGRSLSPRPRALTALPLAALLFAAAPPLAAQAQETTTEAPAATAPATEEAPATGAPVAETPATEAPTAQAPAAEAPATETPAPAAETPAAEAPAADAASPEAPAAETPATATGDTAPAATEDAATDGPADTTPAAVGSDAAAPAAEAAPDAAPAAEPVAAPAPSIFEDPAGAITHMLSQPERRDDLPHDLSPWGMFMAADIVVKAVMLGLAFASLVTWTVWLAKTLEIGGAKARARRVLKLVRSSRTLNEAVEGAAGKGGPAALMLRAAQEEAAMSDAAIGHAGGDGLKERVSSALNRIEAAAGRRISKGTGVLATIGSTAPFVGLFGTVWGIMNSFIGISEAQTTNLAVVAPGIAEALLATALGLVAAIPAVVIYNVFARSITGYRQMLGDVAAGVERLISRDLDFRDLSAAQDLRAHANAAE